MTLTLTASLTQSAPSTYDTDGNLLTSSYDADANGDANEIDTLAYDTDGNLLTSSRDTDADGEPNIISTSTYEGSSIAVHITAFLDTNAG